MLMKTLRKAKWIVVSALCCLLLFGSSASVIHADSATNSYNYSYWGYTVVSPAAYKANKIVDGNSLGIGPLKDPADLHVTANNDIYIVDSGNNRIVILNERFEVIDSFNSFLNKGKQETFSNPQGIFVTDNNEIFIADTGNNRVIHLDEQLKLVKIIDSPESELLTENFQFNPVRVVVDKANRTYVMATGVFDGFMEFNANGDFTTFIGANRVKVDPIEYFWKTIATKEQRSRMIQFTPTEFTNLDINDEGFIYATNGDQWGDNIKKLNAQGTDILRREGYFSPQGDIRYTVGSGPSRMIDIDVTDSEIYSVLDSKRGRIFTYNGDGHLLYVFGGIGNQLGEFNTPSAIERINDNFLVLDKALGEITIFKSTEYGRTLNEAVRSYYRGDEEGAFQHYFETINMNANLEFAYSGIGKALLRQGNYYDAIDYFKESYDQRGYSKAYLLYRKEVLRAYFPAIMTSIFAIVLILFTWKKVRKWKGGKKIVTTD